MSYLDAPTINEIIYNKPRKRMDSVYTKRPNLYNVGELVKFHFGTVIRTGRISNAFCVNGMCSYHIEGEHGTWYRGIDECYILNKISDKYENNTKNSVRIG